MNSELFEKNIGKLILQAALPADDATRDRARAEFLRATGPRAAVGELIAAECARARGWYGRGLPLLELLDRRSRACTAVMAGIYLRVLRRIERQPTIVLDQRVSLPAAEKAWVAARALALGTP